ncbi:hypothetical protein HDU96_006718 [Phlyctochytrium bullatum]|nr:hypothetical protein HDU96_006718 [Phlyctochytrium bullatum]
MVKNALETSKKYTDAATGKVNFKEWGFFPTSRKDFKLFSRAFGNLLYKNNAKLHQHIAQLQSTLPEPIWTHWLANFFVDLLPQEFVWRILDAYLLDGYKALFKIGIALFALEKGNILKCTSMDQVQAIIARIPSTHGEMLFTTAWAVKVQQGDTSDSVFGAFLSDPWPSNDEAKSKFYGTGQCFIFTLRPFAKLYPWVGLDLQQSLESEDQQVRDDAMVRRQHLEDVASFFIMSTKREITVGGGGGKFGITIDHDLRHGTTANCLTFNNEPLTGNKSTDFECLNLEIYAFL